MKNIFLDGDSLQRRSVVIRGENYHYLKNVRRIGVGDRVYAVIRNRRYTLAVSDISNRKITCSIEFEREIRDNTGMMVSVYQGLLKGWKIDFIISKLSEMGVNSFIPLITERTILSARNENRIHRWSKLAREGAQVSGFERVMKITPPAEICKVSDGLRKDENTVIIIFCTEYRRIHLRSFLESLNPAKGLIFHLFFGPEGGFTPDEINGLVQMKGVPVSMGPFVLKSETAALVGTGFIRLFYPWNEEQE